MKPSWPRYRYAPLNLMVLGVLGILGGWSGASGYMAVLLWINAPEKASRLIPLLEQAPFVFFPPLFGPPGLYILAAFSILLLCGTLAVFLRLTTRTKNQEQGTTNLSSTP